MSCRCNVGNVRQAINRIYKEEKNVRGPVVFYALCGVDQEGRACVEHFRELGNLYSNPGSFDERAVSPSSSEDGDVNKGGTRKYTYKQSIPQ